MNTLFGEFFQTFWLMFDDFFGGAVGVWGGIGGGGLRVRVLAQVDLVRAAAPRVDHVEVAVEGGEDEVRLERAARREQRQRLVLESGTSSSLGGLRRGSQAKAGLRAAQAVIRGA